MTTGTDMDVMSVAGGEAHRVRHLAAEGPSSSGSHDHEALEDLRQEATPLGDPAVDAKGKVRCWLNSIRGK